MLKSLFAKPNQHSFGTCFYDIKLPEEIIVPSHNWGDNIPVIPPSYPIPEQSKMFEDLFNTMIIKRNQVDPATSKIIIANVQDRVNEIVDQMFKYRERYQNVSGKYPTKIRWYHIALLYKMESDEPMAKVTPKFNKYMGNGQSLNKKTTIVPVGRGPFSSWEKGCWDAIELQGLHKITDWGVGNTLRILEGFNGTGYRKYYGIQSPYLFSGSNHYHSGKYVSDGNYNRKAVSSQIGVALYLKEILQRME